MTSPCDEGRGDIPIIRKQGVPGGMEAIAFQALIVPNPTTDQARLDLLVPNGDEAVSIALYSAAGQLVATVREADPMEPGTHNFQLSLEELPAGIYFCRIQGNTHQEVLRVIKQ